MLVTVTLFSTSTGFDLCPEPNIPNGGTVNSKKAENFFLGEVTFKHTHVYKGKVALKKGVKAYKC